MTCPWCPKPATTTLVIEPSVWKTGKGEARCVRPEKRAPACEGCAARLSAQPGPPAKTRRRISDEQTNLIDLLAAMR